MKKPPATVRYPHSQNDTMAKDALCVRKVYWGEETMLNQETIGRLRGEAERR